MATLNDFTFPDEVIWEDEFRWTPVHQTARLTVAGTIVIESLFANRDGRPLTLDCGWMRRDDLLLLEALRDAPPEPMPLILDDAREFLTAWKHDQESPIEATPLLPRPEHDDSDYYRVKLFLMEIS